MNTKINLMYRDADNYKKIKEVIVAGEITDAQIALIQSKLQDCEFAIARQVGLPTPSEEMIGEWGFDEHSDHVFTTMLDFSEGTPTADSMLTNEESTEDLSVTDLAARFNAIESWNISAEWDHMLATY